jgi:uncharacterized iron-regulated protein
LLRRLTRALLAGLMAGVLAWPADAASDVEQLRLGDSARRERSVDVVLDGVTDTRTGELIDTVELARRLKDVRVLFIGEEHTNGEFHRVQLNVIEALRAAGRKPIIGLEMFPWGPQPALDRWSRGELDEARFLDESRWYDVWSHHYGHYRDIFRYARDQRLKLVGLNAPRDVVRTVRSKGFEALPPETRGRFPPNIDLSNTEHRTLVRAYFDDDDPLHAKMSDEALEGIYRAQVTWDAAMGWQAGQTLTDPADLREIVVVLIGVGHVAYDLGAARQLASGFKGGIASLIPVTVPKRINAAYAQFVWGIPRTAQPTLPVLGVSLMGRLGQQPSAVIQVETGSSAAAAGVRVGDVLRSLDGTVIDGTVALQRKVGEYDWGDAARLEIERAGVPMTLPLVFRRTTQDAR